jgi:aldehyde dehydrogenase (NAD+)
MGKPVSGAAQDIEEGRNITNYFSGLIELADGQTALNTPEYLNMTIRQPYGVVAGIVPWNFPSMIVNFPVFGRLEDYVLTMCYSLVGS